MQREVRKYVKQLTKIQLATDACIQTSPVFNIPLTSSSRKGIRLLQQAVLSVKISYLPLMEFMQQCTVIVVTISLSVAHKYKFLCNLSNGNITPLVIYNHIGNYTYH